MKFAKVNVLIKGYVKKLGKNRSEYTCTTTLVQDGKLNIIADPGCPKSEIVLKKALKRFGLNFEDIDIVFITHWHLDHSKLVALFPKAKIVDFWEINRGDKHYFHGGKYKITKNVEVIPTAGHSRGHASLKVNTADGIVVIAGDVFWFSDFTPKKDPYASDQKKLEESRRKILKIANYIIPGHGNIVRVEK